MKSETDELRSLKREYKRVGLIHILFIVLGIALNFGLSMLVDKYDLPIYLDTIGTIFVAWECGSFSGIIVALVTNLSYGILCSNMSTYFAVVSIGISMIISYLFKRNYQATKLGYVIVPLSIGVFSGITGGLIEWALGMSSYTDIPWLLLMNIVDKYICCGIAYCLVKLVPDKIRKDIYSYDLNYDIDEQKNNFKSELTIDKYIKNNKKILLVIIVEASILTAVIAWTGVTIFTSNTRAEYEKDVVGVATMVADVVDGERVNAFLQDGHSAPGYDKTNNTLLAIDNNFANVEYVYVYKVVDDGCYIVFDTDDNFQENGVIGEYYPRDKGFEAFEEDLLAGKPIQVVESKNKYGWLMTSLVPIYNRRGECVAYAGADLSMTGLYDYAKMFLIKMILVSLSFLGLTLSIGLWLAGRHQHMAEYQYLQIEKAKEEAERANTAKSRFVANISHELRTPINTIMGMNEMILREQSSNGDDDYSKAVKVFSNNIRQSSELLLGLVNDLLDLSKLESGKMSLIETEYDLSEIIRSVVTMIKIRSDAKGLGFYTQISPEVPTRLYGDQGKLKQVILNLLSNSVKYTDVGGFTLRLTVAETVGDACRLLFAIRDTGRGIKEEEIDKIFSAFERADEEHNTSIQGTGLGLHLCKQYAGLLNGDISCESSYGKGSTFYFIVEQKIVDPTPIGEFALDEVHLDRDGYTPLFTAPKAKLLAIDDNELNLEVIKGLLKEMQIQVSTAISGQEGLQLMQNKTFDVVLLDHMMPQMDGIETLKHIRESYGDIPVIALTANASNDGGEFYKQNGFNDYLSKPVDFIELERMLKQYVPDNLQEEELEVVKQKKTDLSAGMLSEEYAWLEKVDGLSVKIGLGNCGTQEVFVKAVTTFFNTLDENHEVIEKAWKENDIKLYTIKVHALKSSARIIGATELSEMAKALEAAGKEEDKTYIDENTRQTLDLYASFKSKLEPIAKKKDKSGKPDINPTELEEAYIAARVFINDMDYDSLEMVLNELNDYRLPEEDEKIWSEFEKAFKNFDWDEMEALINKN